MARKVEMGDKTDEKQADKVGYKIRRKVWTQKMLSSSQRENIQSQ